MSASARLLGVLAYLLSAVGSAEALRVTDDSGRTLQLDAVPQRIISLAPGATEMLFAVGAGDRVIATVEFSDEPKAARSVPRIGDATAVDLERLIALRPDVVVVWGSGGNVAQIAQLEKLGLPLYRQQVEAFADLPDSLRRLGALTGTPRIAAETARQFEQRLANLRSRYVGESAVSVFLEVWNRPLYTVGGSHLMTDAVELCGARNVFDDLREPGPAVDIEAVIARDPDIIVAVAPTGTAASWLADWKRFATLGAVQRDALIAFEDPRLSRLGPSSLEATELLCRALEARRSSGD